ncbi:tigger transposable element-derived protein 6-like [Saccostrea echinata]|uniref:tigger transposable element-derived protein 6-like n=1 Tax=Saccostrea echinata TaxID=191078 RepID=UPI002A80DF7D|nr:tigger transposable element-derived protein 6-like [Saccostrea echinata]
MALKRKRTDLFLADKYEAVKLLDQKVPQTEIAKKLGCSQPQISAISKNRDTIRKDYETSANPERKRHRSGKAPTVEGALTEWFTKARSKDLPVSSAVLTEKAEDLAARMNIEFTATNGWLSRWKQRNNISYKKMHGEKKDANTDAADHWITDVLPQLMKDYEPQDIYNADETGLYYRALPDGTLTFKKDKLAGSKKAKDRVTVLVTVNMTGTDKRRLLVIGKSKDPRCFRGKKSIPVIYKSSGNAWMTGDLFKQWLTDFNRDMVRQNRKILLLVDNCSAHPKDAADRLTNIRLQFLPANTTSIIQPCDQGIIRNLKALYRSQLIKKMVSEIDSGSISTTTDLAKRLTLLDAVHLLSKAWRGVKETTVVNCYRKAGFQTECTEEMPEEEPTIPECMEREEFFDFVNHDDDTDCHREITDDEICTKFLEEETTRKPEEEVSDEETSFTLPVSSAENKESLSNVQCFLEENGCEDFSAFYALEELC